MFRFGMIPTINKPTRVTRQTASAIDHITINSIMHTGFKSGIIKAEISDHFPIFFCYMYLARKKDVKEEFIYKRRFYDQSIGRFKLRLRNINWSKIIQCRNANEPNINFFSIIDSLYNKCFPVAKIRLKQKKHSTSWITRGIKSPPKKVELIQGISKTKNYLNEERYKIYKILFESSKRRSKKATFQSKYYSTRII